MEQRLGELTPYEVHSISRQMYAGVKPEDAAEELYWRFLERRVHFGE